MAEISNKQIEQYNELAKQYGGVDSQQFKDYVNTQGQKGGVNNFYDSIASQLKLQANQNAVTQSNANNNTQNVNQNILSNTNDSVPITPQSTPNELVKEVTETTTPVTPPNTNNTNSNGLPKNIEQWKTQGSDIDTLRKMIENQYGTKTKYDPIKNELYGIKNGELTKWIFDEAGNPIDESMGVKVDQYGNEIKDQIETPVIPSEDEMFNLLLGGNTLDQYLNTPEYNKAKQRLSLYNRYIGLTADEYSILLDTGEILPNTQTWSDILKDPSTANAIRQARALSIINNNSIPVQDKIDQTELNQTSYILSSNSVLAQYLSDGYLSPTEYSDLTNTPEISSKTTEMEKYRDEYLELQSQYDSIEDEVDKMLEGKGADDFYRANLIAEKTRNLMKPLALAYNKYQASMGDLTTLKNQATSLLNTNLQLYQQEQARKESQQNLLLQRQWQLEDKADDRAYNYAMLQEGREYNQYLLEDQRAYNEQLLADERNYNWQNYLNQLQAQYDYNYGDLNSNNETLQNIAIERAVADLYTKYPIVGMEGQATKVNKVKDLIAKGYTPQGALAQVEQEIRNSQAYKDLMTAQQREMVGTGQENINFGVIGVDPDTGDNIYGFVNTSQGYVTPVNFNMDYSDGGYSTDFSSNYSLISKYPNEASFKNNNPAGITWNSNFDNLTSGSTADFLTQAGVNFTKGTARPKAEWELDGNGERTIPTYYVKFNSIDDGLLAQRVMMEKTYGNASVGTMLQKWVGTNEGPNYAQQVANMAGITDLNVKVKDLTTEQLDALQSAKLKKESPNLYNELINLANISSSQTITYNPKRINEYSAYNTDPSKLPKFRSRSEEQKFKDEAYDYSLYKQAEGLYDVDSLLEDLQYLYENAPADNLWGGVDRIKGWAGFGKYDAVLQNIINQTAFNNLINLKSQGATFGALSDNELKYIKSASEAGRLNYTLSRTDFREAINKLMESSLRLKENIVSGNPYSNDYMNKTGNFVAMPTNSNTYSYNGKTYAY